MSLVSGGQNFPVTVRDVARPNRGMAQTGGATFPLLRALAPKRALYAILCVAPFDVFSPALQHIQSTEGCYLLPNFAADSKTFFSVPGRLPK